MASMAKNVKSKKPSKKSRKHKKDKSTKSKKSTRRAGKQSHKKHRKRSPSSSSSDTGQSTTTSSPSHSRALPSSSPSQDSRHKKRAKSTTSAEVVNVEGSSPSPSPSRHGQHADSFDGEQCETEGLPDTHCHGMNGCANVCQDREEHQPSQGQRIWASQKVEDCKASSHETRDGEGISVTDTTKSVAVGLAMRSEHRKPKARQEAHGDANCGDVASALDYAADSKGGGAASLPSIEGVGTGRRLAESALFKENVYHNGHTEVWGSWYDTSAQQWGYACCRCLNWAEGCAATGIPKHQSDAQASTQEMIDAPCVAAGSALQPRSCFSDPADFVIHWIRSVLQEWREQLHHGEQTVSSHLRFGSLEKLAEAERAMSPLLGLLQPCSTTFCKDEDVHVWSVGNDKWMKDGKVLEVLALSKVVITRGAGNEGTEMSAGSVFVCHSGGEARKWIRAEHLQHELRKARQVKLSKETIDKLEQIATLATDREYCSANQAYIELTVGHGKWHEDLSVKGLTGCNKAPRGGFKVKKDLSSFLDTEEAKDYMFCLKRLMAFLQLIRPNSDVSKHCAW